MVLVTVIVSSQGVELGAGALGVYCGYVGASLDGV